MCVEQPVRTKEGLALRMGEAKSRGGTRKHAHHDSKGFAFKRPSARVIGPATSNVFSRGEGGFALVSVK